MSMPPGRNLFAEFKGSNRVLVETGSYRGDGIQLALDAGYEKIISIDRDPEAIEFCRNRFDLYNNHNENIKLISGDSAEFLYHVIKHINEPITFWLDSHWQLLEGTEPGVNPFPLVKELHQIIRHPIKSHTIIIDDILILTHPDTTNWSKRMIEQGLKSINPAYTLDYFANPVINNILVAHL
jgi:hypothetical protein